MTINFTWLVLVFCLIFVNGDDDCGETEFDDSFGDIKSADFQSGLTCTYKIRREGSVVKLQWSHFKIDGRMPDCSTDHVVVKTG